jgi:hypothetical protein
VKVLRQGVIEPPSDFNIFSHGLEDVDDEFSQIADESSTRQPMTSALFAADTDDSAFGGASQIGGIGYSPTDAIDTAVAPGSDSFINSSQSKPHSIQAELQKVSQSLDSFNPTYVRSLNNKDTIKERLRTRMKKRLDNISLEDEDDEATAQFRTPRITKPKEHLIRQTHQLKRQKEELLELAQQKPLQRIKLKPPQIAEQLEEESDKESEEGIYTGKLPLTKGLKNANIWRNFYFDKLKGTDQNIHGESSVSEIRKQCVPYALKLYKSLGGEKQQILKSKNPEQIYDAYKKLYTNVGKKLRSGQIYI